MTNRFRSVFLTSLIACGVFYADAQTARPGPRATTAETGLVGVRLLDSGARVIQLFGSPDEILGLTAGGGGSVGGGGGASGGGGGNRGGGGPGASGVQAELSIRPGTPNLIGDPFGQGNLQQLRPNQESRDGAGSSDGAPGGGGRAAAGGGEGGGGGAGAGGGSGERITFTRWVYKRQNAHYAFVFDRFNRVVQIEALGLRDSRVRTRKGISFGSSFSDLIRRYGAPDAYEIGGDTIVVRFLVKDRVAFRLSRTEPKKPHRVTGVVVAAGKA